MNLASAQLKINVVQRHDAWERLPDVAHFQNGGIWHSELTSSDLELARPLLWPPFDHDFLFGVELDSVATLAMHHSEETVLPATEGEVGHRCSDADVDSDVTSLYFIAKFARG